jgi:hypothetical protein
MRLGQQPDFSTVESGSSSTAPGFLERTFGVGSKFSDWLANNPLTNALVGVRDYSVDEAKQKIRELYNTGMEFQQVFAQLQGYSDVAQSDPALSSQYSALMSRGSVVRQTISSAVAAAQNVVAYAQDKLGLDFSDVGTPPPGLGVLPALIPAAIIGAVVAAVALAGAWIVDARSAITKLDQIQQIAMGVPPEQRASVIRDLVAKTGGIGDQFQKIVLWGAIAAAVIVFGPTLYKRLRK